VLTWDEHLPRLSQGLPYSAKAKRAESNSDYQTQIGVQRPHKTHLPRQIGSNYLPGMKSHRHAASAAAHRKHAAGGKSPRHLPASQDFIRARTAVAATLLTSSNFKWIQPANPSMWRALERVNCDGRNENILITPKFTWMCPGINPAESANPVTGA